MIIVSIWLGLCLVGALLCWAGMSLFSSGGFIGNGFAGMALIAVGIIPLLPVVYPLYKLYCWAEDRRDRNA
jgi:hypothetical protein